VFIMKLSRLWLNSCLQHWKSAWFRAREKHVSETARAGSQLSPTCSSHSWLLSYRMNENVTWYTNQTSC
jgi:hypothetical protein